MPKITKKAKADASIKLLGVNSELHLMIGEIGTTKKDVGKVSTLPASIIPKALELSLEGQALTTQFLPNAVELEYHISEATGEQLPGINPLVKALQAMNGIYKPENDTVDLWVEDTAFLSNTIINWLSNLFHDVAGKLIVTSGQIQACSAVNIDSEEMASIAKYCSGVLTQAVVTKGPLKYLPATISGKQKVVQHYPTNVIHSLGIKQHKVETSTLTTGEKPNVAIEYHDSYDASHAGSVARLKGVKSRLEKEDLLCFAQHPNLYCSGQIDAAKLTNLAAFFSLVINADIHLGKDAIPVVSDALWDYVNKLVLKHGDATWESGQGLINWDSMHSKWLQDKETLAKSKIYGDLKQLAIYRDRHHELENAMGVDVGVHAGKKAVTDIAANAEKALTLTKKNKWAESYLNKAQSLLKQFKTSGSGDTSDLLGNTIHNILIHELAKLGEYGNCPTGTSLHDINAGALSYCEGALTGTVAQPIGGGASFQHKVAPKSYHLVVEDEDPKGGYNVFIPIDKGFWNQELADYLESKFGFDCKNVAKGKWGPGEVCGVHIDSHDKIRLLAIFLSNLKGGSDTIGKECVPLAMKEAWNIAQQQAKKGVMAFTQEPLIESSKEWIDKCYKTYGIMPPGLTAEQQTLLKLIGPDKIYGGCDLSAKDTVPNMGIISYCEGVRTNPQAVVSAHLTPSGFLQHFFHSTTDKLADILVNPLEDGKYAVEIKNIDMRTPEVTDEVIKHLKGFNYDCHGNTCAKEVNENDIRWLAMFLSSLHQVHHLKGSQMPKAISLAINKTMAIPNDKTAFEQMVYPYTQKDWEKELGAAPAPVTKGKPLKGVIQPPVPAGKVYPKLNWQYINSLPKKGKPPWSVGGCVSYVSDGPTKVKLGYCAGVIREALDNKGNVTSILPAVIQTKGNSHPIAGDGEIIFDSKWNTLYITLPDELAKIKPVVIALESFDFKHTGETTWHKLATSYQAARVGYFFSQLHNITQLPESCWEAAVLHALKQIGTETYVSPVYPVNKEDWLKDVCKIEAPPEKQIAFSALAEGAQSVALAAMCSYAENGKPLTDALGFFAKQYANVVFGAMTKGILTKAYEDCLKQPPQPIDELIEKSQTLMATSYLEIPPDQMKKAKETNAYKKLPKKVKDWMHHAINNHLLLDHKNEKTVEQTLSGLTYLFIELNKIPITPLMIKLQVQIEKKSKIRKGELPAEDGEKVEKIYEKLHPDEQIAVHDSMVELLDDHIIPAAIEHIEIEFGLTSSPGLEKMANEAEVGIDKSNEPLAYVALASDMKKLLAQAISEKAAEGKDANTIDAEISEQFNVKSGWSWGQIVKKEIDAYESIISKSKVPIEFQFVWEDLPPGEMQNYILEAYGWAKDNPAYEQAQIMAALESKYNFAYTKALSNISKMIINSAKSFKEGKINKAGYDAPWVAGGWESIPIEIAACMGKLLNEMKPGTTLTGLFAPIMTKKHGGFTEEQIGKWWLYCVDQYENEQELKALATETLAEAKAELKEEKPATHPQAIKDWLYQFLKEHPTWKVSPKGASKWVESISIYKDPGDVAVKAMLDELVQEGKIVYELGTGFYVFEAPMGKPPLKFSELDLPEQLIIKTDLVSQINAGIPKATAIKTLMDFYYLPVDGLSDLWDKTAEEMLIAKEVPSINEFMDAEPSSAEQMELLAVYLMEQSKYSANEISKAIAGKYAVKDDLSLTEWIVKIKEHHELKVQLGIKFGELDEENKTDVINYIVDHSEYPEDEIVSLAYDTLGVMADDELLQEIKQAKKGLEYYEEPVIKHWSALDDAQQIAFAVKVTESNIQGLDGLLHFAAAHSIYPVADELPSVMELIVMAKTKPEEVTYLDYTDLTAETKEKIAKAVANFVDSGMEEQNIHKHISDDFLLEASDDNEAMIEGFISGYKIPEEEEEEPEGLSPEHMETYDEMMKAYIQVGWTPAALIEFFAGKIPADQLKKTANKLYKLYKPEVVRITQQYDGISAPLKEHLKGVASKLLNEGKGVADTSWYISVNYGIEKESVKVMVREVAEKPLEQVEAAVKAMQFLGVGEFIGGCRIIEPLSSLTPQNVSYCQGILEKKGELTVSGASILHAMGHQEIEVFSDLTDSKWETKIVLETDGGEGNKEKLQGVWDILGNFMNCQYPGGKVVTCQLSGKNSQKLPIADQDKLRKAALFLSSIDNVALLDKGCIPYALKHAMQSAKKKNETTQPWTTIPYPNEVEDWNKIICSKILA